MQAQFSEFSYGFAFTHELVNNLPGITVAPQFPSLVEEGKVGYDAMMNIRGIPLYLQYKLTRFLKGRSAKYWNYYHRSFYQFDVTPHRRSPQHGLLKNLADSGKEVLYVAPRFNTSEEFNFAFRDSQVGPNSVCVPVGALPRLRSAEYLQITFYDCESILWHLRRLGVSPVVSQDGISQACCNWAEFRERFELRDTQPIDAEYLHEIRDTLTRILADSRLTAPHDVTLSGTLRDPRRDDDLREVARDVGNMLSTYTISE
ncbi:MAG: hypothetical protein OXC95_09675 [Dehalococcoidia bacterium]|nr:hypothetical protein [Dehalococcoidia bacterium]